MNRLIGPLFLGILLTGCASERYEGAYISENRTVMEKPVVTFSPQRDVMTDAGVRASEIDVYSSRSVDMTAPDVILGPGDYRQKRYSPSIFKDGRR